jgi:hypothetical protein
MAYPPKVVPLTVLGFPCKGMTVQATLAAVVAHDRELVPRS